MTLTRPPLSFTVHNGEETLDIKMTYGLFNEIMHVIPDPQNISELLITDQGLRDYVLRRMLTGNKRVEKEEDLIDPFTLELDLQEVNDLILWVGDHILYFFTTSMTKVMTLGEKYEPTIRQLAQSKNGSENKDSKEDSSGSSTAAKAT